MSDPLNDSGAGSPIARWPTWPASRAVDVPTAGTVFRVASPADPTLVTFEQHIDGRWWRWSVAEVDARAVPGAHAARCLIFSRQDCIRRVWDYPTDWGLLDDAALVALSWHR